jgi:hypothetical protein
MGPLSQTSTTSAHIHPGVQVISANALADSIASLGLAVACYYGITAFSASSKRKRQRGARAAICL